MRHKWDHSQYGSHPRDVLVFGRRICKECGVTQRKHSKRICGRVIGYEWDDYGGKNCPGKVKSSRHGCGYQVAISDKLFFIWQSPELEKLWYVNLVPDVGECLHSGGHRTKREAMKWLVENWHEDWDGSQKANEAGK